jgi:hypothetical protein
MALSWDALLWLHFQVISTKVNDYRLLHISILVDEEQQYQGLHRFSNVGTLRDMQHVETSMVKIIQRKGM